MARVMLQCIQTTVYRIQNELTWKKIRQENRRRLLTQQVARFARVAPAHRAVLRAQAAHGVVAAGATREEHAAVGRQLATAALAGELALALVGRRKARATRNAARFDAHGGETDAGKHAVCSVFRAERGGHWAPSRQSPCPPRASRTRSRLRQSETGRCKQIER